MSATRRMGLAALYLCLLHCSSSSAPAQPPTDAGSRRASAGDGGEAPQEASSSQRGQGASTHDATGPDAGTAQRAEGSPDAAQAEADTADAATGCSRAELEDQMHERLDTLSTDTDFSLYLERSGGESFRFERGSSSLATLYESASTSKMVTAAVILWLVDRGDLALDDTPSALLPETVWTLEPSDPLNAMTLEQLLSFTSGLRNEALCINAAAFDYMTCVGNTLRRNADSDAIPGAAFNYNGAHMQVAGAMAVQATGAANWHEIFRSFKAETGLFADSDYDLPSADNPRLAGGMHWTAEDYVAFMRAYRDGAFASGAFAQAVTDRTVDADMEASPSIEGLSETWHYGPGLWIECRSESFNCERTTYVSSPGAYGAYPFFHLDGEFFGLLARQGSLRSFPEGIQVVDAVRAEIEAWAACRTP